MSVPPKTDLGGRLASTSEKRCNMAQRCPHRLLRRHTHPALPSRAWGQARNLTTALLLRGVLPFRIGIELCVLVDLGIGLVPSHLGLAEGLCLDDQCQESQWKKAGGPATSLYRNC